MENKSIAMANIKKTMIEISSTTLFKILALALLIAFLYYISDIVLMVFIALVLSSAIGPWVNWFQKFKVPRTLGTIFIYVSGFGLLVLSIWLLINPISVEIKNLAEDFPGYWQQLNYGWQSFDKFSQSHGWQQEVAAAISSIETTMTALATNLFGGAISFVGGAFTVLMVLVITFYLAVYDSQMKKKIAQIVPKKYEAYSIHLIERMQEKIGMWLRGQIILSLVIFLMTYAGLSLLGVKYALVLALLAGVTEIIPYFGPIIAGVPAIFVAFTQEPYLGLMTLLMFFIIHQSENYFITPQIMRKAVGLNPVIVIVSMLVGARIAGIAGILIAVPVATALSVLTGDILTHRKIGFSTFEK